MWLRYFVVHCLLRSIVRLGCINHELLLEMEKIMKTTAIPRSAVSNPSVSKTAASIDTVSLSVIGLCASAISVWSFACIVGGIVSGGGLGSMLTGWFNAVTGL